jgi:hypothetical protein
MHSIREMRIMERISGKQMLSGQLQKKDLKRWLESMSLRGELDSIVVCVRRVWRVRRRRLIVNLLLSQFIMKVSLFSFEFSALISNVDFPISAIRLSLSNSSLLVIQQLVSPVLFQNFMLISSPSSSCDHPFPQYSIHHFSIVLSFKKSPER